MNKISKLIATLTLMLAFTGVTFGQNQTVTLGDHDFRANNWGGGGGVTVGACEACHTPHNADATATIEPLWNHVLTTDGFTVYTSSTFDGSAGQPTGNSKMCLSCHDGNVAIDSYGTRVGTTFISGDHNLGRDLSNDHPVSFDYLSSHPDVTSLDLADPDGAGSSFDGVGTISQNMLFSGKMQCASCHDPHETTNGDFLIMDNSGDALCIVCHTK